MTSLFIFLLISIRVIKPIEDLAVYNNLVQKLKELVNLCSLCKSQLFAISNKEKKQELKTAKLLGGKRLISLYILCKFWHFSKRVCPKLSDISGSNFKR